MANTESFAAPGSQLIEASKINGTAVYNPAREKLGNINDLMFNKTTGKAEYAIMSFGGFLGIGEGYTLFRGIN